MILKLCVILLLHFNFIKAYTEDEMMKVFRDLGDICLKQFPVDEAIKENVNQDRKWSEDETFKCYLHCLIQEAEAFTKEGTIDEDACIAYLADNYRDEFIPIVRRCGTKKGANDCDTAWLTFQCWGQSPRYKLL